MSKKHKEKLDKTDLNYDTIVSLLNIYLSEWDHRDHYLWVQAYTYYYAILIVILFPELTNLFQINLPLPTIIFRIMGMILSFVFLYVTFGYVIRFQAIADTYQTLINELPEKYRRKSINEYRTGRIFKLRLAYFVCFSLFLTLFSISIVLIVIS